MSDTRQGIDPDADPPDDEAAAPPVAGAASFGRQRLAAGTLVDERYEIIEFLGEGGFATVYKARHVHIQRLVAIKLLDTSGLSSTSEFEQRFAREAQTAAQLEHPNVVTVHDFGFTGERRQPYIAMELLEGLDLEQALERDGPLSPGRAVRLFTDCLEALGEAHGAGIVHKDLKPSNLFIHHPGTAREALRILDFGVASINQAGTHRLTGTGQMMGTPQYLAPEYIQDQIALPTFDVYQMALILIEVLTGRPVIDCSHPFQALMAHCQGNYEVPDCILESPLGPVLETALRIDHTERYPDATAFREALLAVDLGDLERPFGDSELVSRSRIEQAAALDAASAAAALESALGTADTRSLAADTPSGDTANLDDVDDVDDLDDIDDDSGPAVAASPSPPSRAPLLAMAAIALAVVIVAAVLLATGGDDPGQDTAQTEASAAQPLPPLSPAATSPPGRGGVEPAQTSDLASPHQASPRESSLDDDRADPRAVTLFVAPDPPGARVFLGDELVLESTPDVLELPAGDEPVSLRFELEGYETAEHQVVPTEDTTVTVSLERVRRKKRPRRDRTADNDNNAEPPTPPADEADEADEHVDRAAKIAP